jgi:excisionase family DNA binding protein
MLLSVEEAAQLLRRPARTVRSMLARGELKGARHNGAWGIPREALPLTDERLAEVQRRAEQMRAAVEAALPSWTGLKRGRSVADFAPFLAAREVLLGLDADSSAREPLGRALHALGRATHRWRAEDKRAALLEARDALCDSVTALLIVSDPSEPLTAARLRLLEGSALAPIGGLLRWAERAT